ncbi:hypothetical protein [Archaeoglobus sp.]
MRCIWVEYDVNGEENKCRRAEKFEERAIFDEEMAEMCYVCIEGQKTEALNTIAEVLFKEVVPLLREISDSLDEVRKRW